MALFHHDAVSFKDLGSDDLLEQLMETLDPCLYPPVITDLSVSDDEDGSLADSSSSIACPGLVRAPETRGVHSLLA